MYLVLNIFLNHPKISFLDYLDFEEKSEQKHEYHNGKLRIMPGGTSTHNKIGANISRIVGNALIEKDKDCDVYSSDMKISNATLQSALYPDLTVVCGDTEYFVVGRKDVIANPTVLFEVISPSTGTYDYSGKFSLYKTFTSLRQYVLIEQDTPYIEVRTLENIEKNSWTFETYEDMDAIVELKSIGISLPLKEIYRRVKFEE